MKLLFPEAVLLLVAIISAQTLSHISYPPESNFSLNEDPLQRTSAAVMFRRRFDRDVGDVNLETHVSKLKMVARITNGISIIMKSMYGSLDFEQFLSEVLRFGDVKSAQIEGLDEAKLDEFLNNLKSLPADVIAKDNLKDKVEKVEKVFDGLKKILDEVDGVGDIREWKKGKELFLKEIERLESNGVPMGFMNSIDAAAANWKLHFPIIFQNDSASTPTSKNVEEIKKDLEDFKESSLTFDNRTTFWSFNNFTNAVDGISPVLKAAKGVHVYDIVLKTIVMTESDEKDFSDYIDLVASKLNGSFARMDYVQTVLKLLAARAVKTPHRKLENTIGLPNGGPDFSMLPDDIEDAWIQKVIKTKSLQSPFSHFKEIGNLLNNIDKSIGVDSKGLDKMLHFLNSISKSLAELDTAKSGIQQGSACDRPRADPIEVKSFATFLDSLKTIDNNLAMLKNETKRISTLVKKPEILKIIDEVIAVFLELKKDETNLQDVLNKLRVYGNIKQLNDHIVEVKSTVIGSYAESVKTEAKNVLGNNGSLNEYQNLIGHYAAYFKCLQDQDKLKLIFKSLDGLNEIRGWGRNTEYSMALSDGTGVMNKVTSVKGDLLELKKAMGVLEKLDSPEARTLRAFSAASTLSKNLGNAVQALAGMSLALNKRKAIQTVVDNIPVVSSHKAQLTDAVDVANLDELVGSSSEIGEMLDSLSNFKKTVGSFVSSDTFAAQSEIFENGKNVTGVTGDFSGMSEAVGKLKKTVKGQDASKLNDVEAGLNTMDSLNLNFASFKTDLDASKKSLAELDLFFASNFKASKVTLSPGNTPSGNQANPTILGGQQFWTTTGVDEKKELKVDLLAGIAASFLVLLLLVILIHGLLHKYKRRWLVDHYCIKWKATPEILFDIYYEYFKRKFDAIRNGVPQLKGHMGAICYSYFDGAFENDTIDASKKFETKEFDKKDSRHVEPLWAENVPVLKGYGDRFENNFFHANMCSFYTRKEWMLTEAPQMKSADKNCTISKMFWMAKQNGTSSIVMLCDLVEQNVTLCDRYYPETPESEPLKFGDLTVRCQLLKTHGPKLNIRLLCAKFGDEEEFNVFHYKYTGLDVLPGFPSSMDDLMFLYNTLEEDINPPIIHCSGGNARSGLFTFGAMLYDNLKKTQKVDFKTCLTKIRKLRAGAISGAADYSYGGRICLELVAKKAKLNAQQQKNYEVYLPMGEFVEGSMDYLSVLRTG